MRVSVDPNDPGFNKDAPYYLVFLDDVEVDYAITADEEDGLIVAYDQDEQGYFRMDKEGNLLTKSIFGVVRVRRANTDGQE